MDNSKFEILKIVLQTINLNNKKVINLFENSEFYSLLARKELLNFETNKKAWNLYDNFIDKIFDNLINISDIDRKNIDEFNQIIDEYHKSNSNIIHNIMERYRRITVSSTSE